MRYDLTTKQCTELKVVLDEAAECTCAVVINSPEFNTPLILVAGGWDGTKALGRIQIFEVLNDAPYLRRFSVSGDLTTARNRPAAVVISK